LQALGTTVAPGALLALIFAGILTPRQPGLAPCARPRLGTAMHTILYQAQPGLVAPVRMIWLPGAFQGPDDFLRAGFDTVTRKRRLAIDLQFVRSSSST